MCSTQNFSIVSFNFTQFEFCKIKIKKKYILVNSVLIGLYKTKHISFTLYWCFSLIKKLK